MTRMRGFVEKQTQIILDNPKYANLCAVLLALLPYVGWISLTIIALVTLRKGWQHGLNVLLPVLVIHFAISLLSLPVIPALINTLLIFLPCYIAACALRAWVSWQAVASMFFLLVLGLVLTLHILMPDFIKAQYFLVQKLINEMHGDSLVATFINDAGKLDQQALANFLLGVQAVSVMLSATFPLLLARSLQARLFYPGAFRQEMFSFRGNKVGLLVLVILIFGVAQGNTIAMNLLPLVGLYFCLAGISLSANGLMRRKIRGVFFLLFVPLLLLPFIMMPAYVVLGSLDSLFDFRVYFAEA